MSRYKLILILFFISNILHSQKEVYIPSYIANDPNIDLNDINSQWCYARSMESENIVVFWEPGFGNNPTDNVGDYFVDINDLISNAEATFNYYIDSLKFAEKGSSVTDQYKLMIFLLYTTDWAAYGSGQDDLVGSLHINPAAARSNAVVAHEIGHCFQYITGCDTDGGYRYGYGLDGAGGNGFWEQCAQWMSFQVYQENIFDEVFNYANNSNLNILHEFPRYANYFIIEYWAYKHGDDIIGKLWRESVYPEDPVETYKRINNYTQQQFNDDIYEHAARLTTWDLPKLKDKSNTYLNARPQPKLIKTNDGYWMIDSTDCIENYGYNCIKLNVPSNENIVIVNFKGLAGQSGFRSININEAGWRYGFAALLNDGTRQYSDFGSANFTNGQNPTEQSLSFVCPDNCNKLWLVVSGASQNHWRHEWDDDEGNDEQWPYQVRFENTDVYSINNQPIHDLTLTYDIEMEPRQDYTPNTITLDEEKINRAFAMTTSDITTAWGQSIKYYAINPDDSYDGNSTAFAPGHWFDKEGMTTNWSNNNSYIYSELNVSSMLVNIGQYPDRAKHGDSCTIKQALVFTKNQNEQATVILIFNVKINDETISSNKDEVGNPLKVYPNPTNSFVKFEKEENWKLYDQIGKLISNGNGKEIEVKDLSNSIYFLRLNESVHKVIKY